MTAFNLSTGAGGSAGLLSGGYLTGEFGWRAVFWLSTVVSGVLLAGSLLARVRAAVSRTGRTAREEKSVTVRQSRSGEVAAVAANLLVFVNYSIWVVSLPLLGAEKFGFDAGQVGLMLLFVNVVHLASAVPFGGIIRKAGGARALALGFGVGGAGMLLVPFAPSAPGCSRRWRCTPLARLLGTARPVISSFILEAEEGVPSAPFASRATSDSSPVPLLWACSRTRQVWQRPLRCLA